MTGKVLVSALIENLADLYEVEAGRRSNDEVRRAQVPEAVVDPGVVGLLLPSRFVQQLGLRIGWAGRSLGAVRLNLHDRECTMEVGQVDDSFPVTIGRLPLTAMDLVVDPRQQRVIGNPEHNGKFIMDVFSVERTANDRS